MQSTQCAVRPMSSDQSAIRSPSAWPSSEYGKVPSLRPVELAWDMLVAGRLWHRIDARRTGASDMRRRGVALAVLLGCLGIVPVAAVASTDAAGPSPTDVMAGIRGLADRDAKSHTPQPQVAVLEFQDNRLGLTKPEIIQIYDAEYDAETATGGLWSEVKANAWIAAILFLFIAVFRDALKTALTKLVGFVSESV